MLRPTAIKVTPLDNYKLKLVFDDNSEKTFDVVPFLSHKAFASVNDVAVFNLVKTNGITVEWPDEIDICPDDLFYNSY